MAVSEEDALSIQWRKGELIGSSVFSWVYMGVNLDSTWKSIVLSFISGFEGHFYMGLLARKVGLLRSNKIEVLGQFEQRERERERCQLGFVEIWGGRENMDFF